eukprot:7156134-Ditylum_brightwellii.AAC.1
MQQLQSAQTNQPNISSLQTQASLPSQSTQQYVKNLQHALTPIQHPSQLRIQQETPFSQTVISLGDVFHCLHPPVLLSDASFLSIYSQPYPAPPTYIQLYITGSSPNYHPFHNQTIIIYRQHMVDNTIHRKIHCQLYNSCNPQ